MRNEREERKGGDDAEEQGERARRGKERRSEGEREKER